MDAYLEEYHEKYDEICPVHDVPDVSHVLVKANSKAFDSLEDAEANDHDKREPCEQCHVGHQLTIEYSRLYVIRGEYGANGSELEHETDSESDADIV